MKEHELRPELTGLDYYQTVINGFKSSGFPITLSSEIAMTKGYKEENPIIMSGKFIRTENGKGTRISTEFEIELFSLYPEISVEEGMRRAGLDPIDVGYQRIQKIKKQFESRVKKMYEANSSKKDYEYMKSAELEEPSYIMEADKHPYVRNAEGVTITLREAFYNEAYLLTSLPLDELFEMYELKSSWFSDCNKVLIHSKLYRWTVTEDKIKDNTEKLLIIQKRRTQTMNRLIAENFKKLGKRQIELEIDKRRNLCKWIQDLPRDPWGFYTQKRILEMMGIAKSTYYELLNNEHYGCSAKNKADQDEQDILLIREVLDYKGFEKGIRQVYMMMPKITGVSFSIHRIRRLMNKYGIGTTIRRPSKNRKAMKELIERNRKANFLLRRFKLHHPNEVRLTDVTYLDYGDEKRAYGSASIDPVTGRLVCFVISENNDLQLALDTLKAMDAYPAASGAIIHSDQGILYMTDDFQNAVKEKEFIQSMSRRGNCWDNSPQESFFGHFKDESHYKECWTLKELNEKVREYSVYYNEERRMWDRNRMTPEEFEGYLLAMNEEEFKGYLAVEEERYLLMKEKSAARAVQNAKEYKETMKDKLEEMQSEACRQEEKI
jgi:transposase InsO family protein